MNNVAIVECRETEKKNVILFSGLKLKLRINSFFFVSKLSEMQDNLPRIVIYFMLSNEILDYTNEIYRTTDIYIPHIVHTRIVELLFQLPPFRFLQVILIIYEINFSASNGQTRQQETNPFRAYFIVAISR